MILQRAGYRVDVATNVAEARRLLERGDRQYVALLACHTIPIDLQGTLQEIRSPRKIPVYRMEEMLRPDDLVKQVSTLMRQR